MNITRVQDLMISLIATAGVLCGPGSAALAGCGCQNRGECQGHHGFHGAQHGFHGMHDGYHHGLDGFDHSISGFDDGMGYGLNPIAQPQPYGLVQRRSLPAVAPPPGTLGMTYRQPSRLIPEDKHPRLGMIEVKSVPRDAEVSIKGMEGYFGKDGIWHFESEKPLLPGIPHIYLVKVVCFTSDGQEKTDVRTFRLIPGRIVSLSYDTPTEIPVTTEEPLRMDEVEDYPSLPDGMLD